MATFLFEVLAVAIQKHFIGGLRLTALETVRLLQEPLASLVVLIMKTGMSLCLGLVRWLVLSWWSGHLPRQFTLHSLDRVHINI